MAIATDIGYRHRLEDTFQGKAHYISFGCSKALPRHHVVYKTTLEFSELRKESPC
jgi:hypothetical protein